MIEGEHLDSSSVCELLTSLNKNEFPNEVKLDTVHSALCLFSARNSRKQIERATRTRRSRRLYKIHYIPWTVIVSPRWESESKTGLNHRNRLTPIRLHSPAGISFPSDEISFIFFFPHRSSANFRSSTPLPIFFLAQNATELDTIQFRISSYPNFRKDEETKIYFPIKKQYEYKI